MDKEHIKNQYQNYVDDLMEKEAERYYIRCERNGETPTGKYKQWLDLLSSFLMEAFERGIDGLEPPTVIDEIREGTFEEMPIIDVPLMVETANAIEEAYERGTEMLYLNMGLPVVVTE